MTKNEHGVWVYHPVKIGGVSLENTRIRTFELTNNVVKTVVNGHAGTVKEFITATDYAIQIVGTFTAHTHLDLCNKITALNKLARQTTAQDIVCDILNLMDIFKVVVERVSIPELACRTLSQYYEIQCVSDTDYVAFPVDS